MLTIDTEISCILFSVIKEAVMDGEEVVYTKFGKFYPIHCECCGHVKEIGFRGSTTLKEALNDGKR